VDWLSKPILVKLFYQTTLSPTYLFVLSGKGKFQIADEKKEHGVIEGDLLFWKKGIYHGYNKIIEHPLIVLVFDSPIRDPNDVVFFNPKQIPEIFL